MKCDLGKETYWCICLKNTFYTAYLSQKKQGNFYGYLSII